MLNNSISENKNNISSVNSTNSTTDEVINDYMPRNEKVIPINQSKSIKISNEFAKAQYNKKLKINHYRLIAFAIFSTQKFHKNEFQKSEFETFFELDYKSTLAKDDTKQISDLKFSLNDSSPFKPMFLNFYFENGRFFFEWSDAAKAHIDFVEKENRYQLSEIFENSLLAKLLKVNQHRLFMFAISSTTQKEQENFFTIEEFNQYFYTHYPIELASEDSDLIGDLKFFQKEGESLKPVFKHFIFNQETQTFHWEWSDEVKTYFQPLKTDKRTNKYTPIYFDVHKKFKSAYSWRLYNYLRGSYGNFNIKFSKGDLLRIFSVEDVDSYQTRTQNFITTVINTALQDINDYTELRVECLPEKKSNDSKKISTIRIRWSMGKVVTCVTHNQLDTIKMWIDRIEDNEKTIHELNHKMFLRFVFDYLKSEDMPFYITTDNLQKKDYDLSSKPPAYLKESTTLENFKEQYKNMTNNPLAYSLNEASNLIPRLEDYAKVTELEKREVIKKYQNPKTQ